VGVLGVSTEAPSPVPLPAAGTERATEPATARAREPLSRRMSAWFGRAWPPLLILAAAIGVWEGYTRWRNVDPTVLPPPSTIVQSTIDDWANIRTNSWVTLQETVAGLGLAILAALVLGVVMDFIPWVRRGLYPIMVSSQTIPIVAIAPLVIIWFGFGLFPKVLVVAFYTFFPIVVGLSQGLAGTDPDAMNLLRSMRASRWQIFWRVRFPSALPQFFTGLRITVTYAVVAAVFAEYVGSFEGLGIYIQQMRNAFRTDLVFSAVLATMVLTLALFALVLIAERLAMPWHRSAKREEGW
jgi:ABC-type nitrate/sulfonate/bicarbonate transport system permease component